VIKNVEADEGINKKELPQTNETVSQARSKYFPSPQTN